MTDEERRALERKADELRRRAEERGVFVKARTMHKALRKKYNR